MKRLSEAEFKVMDIIWTLDSKIITTNLVINRLANHENWTRATISTLLNRLVSKQHLRTVKNGKEREFYPITLREEYVGYETENFISNYHNHSLLNLATSLTDFQLDDLLDLEEWIKEQKAKLD